MSVERVSGSLAEWRCRCDVEACGAELPDRAASAVEVRGFARSAGWRVVDGATIEDLCPVHRTGPSVERDRLRLFDDREDGPGQDLRAAIAYAVAGGQALHVWDPGEAGSTWPRAPQVFRQSRPWAHLFDANAARLEATARRLGVRVVLISHRGTRHQHVDLCSTPLRRAIDEATNKVLR